MAKNTRAKQPEDPSTHAIICSFADAQTWMWRMLRSWCAEGGWSEWWGEGFQTRSQFPIMHSHY